MQAIAEFDELHDPPDNSDIDELQESFVNELNLHQLQINKDFGGTGNWQEENFEDSQRNYDAAKEAIDKATRTERNSLLRTLKDIKQKISILERRNMKNNKDGWPLKDGREHTALIKSWKEANAKRAWIEYKRDNLPIWHPTESIKAIQIKHVKKKKNIKHHTKKYFALAEGKDGELINKEVDEGFLQENLQPKFWEALQYHDKNKGWVSFDPSNGPMYFQEDRIEEIKGLDPVYKFKPNKLNDRISWIKIQLELMDNEVAPGQRGFSLKPESTKYFYKTVATGKYYRVTTFADLSRYIGHDSLNQFDILAFDWATRDIRSKRMDKGFETEYHTPKRGSDGKLKKDKKVIRLIDLKDPDLLTFETNRGNIDLPQIVHFSVWSDRYEVEPATREISKIRWNSDKKEWEGIYQQPIPGTDRTDAAVTKLTTEWVNKCFTPTQITAFHDAAIKGQRKFLRVPVGDLIEVEPTMDISMNPKIAYRNNESEICAYASFASALHYMGWHDASKFVRKLSDQMRTDVPNELKHIVNQFHQHGIFSDLRKIYQVQAIRRGFVPEFNPDNKNKEADILLVVLHQSDNCCSHSVAITGNYIFDCNVNNALPFEREALDCCCGKDAHFDFVEYGYLFSRNDPNPTIEELDTMDCSFDQGRPVQFVVRDKSIARSAFCSFANALFFLGYESEALEVNNLFTQYSENCAAFTKPLQFIVQFMMKEKIFSSFRKIFHLKKWKNYPFNAHSACIVQFMKQPIDSKKSKFIDSGYHAFVNDELINPFADYTELHYNLSTFGKANSGYVIERK